MGFSIPQSPLCKLERQEIIQQAKSNHCCTKMGGGRSQDESRVGGFEVDPAWQSPKFSRLCSSLARNLDTTGRWVTALECSFEYQTFAVVVSNGIQAPTVPKARGRCPMG
jgi:hypothetical protein